MLPMVFFIRQAVLGTKVLPHLQATKEPLSANVLFSHYRLGGRVAICKRGSGLDEGALLYEDGTWPEAH
jgi:hypothetical protein